MKGRRGANAAAESHSAASTRASRRGTQGQSPNQAGGVADGLRRWLGTDARAGYESRAGFQPGCSQLPLPARNEVWTINALPRQAGEKDPSSRWGNWKTWLEEERRQQHDLLLQMGRSLPGTSVPQTQNCCPNATSSFAHTCSAGSGPWHVCLQGQSCKEEPRPCHILPCPHLSLLPRQHRITENNSSLSIHIEIFF